MRLRDLPLRAQLMIVFALLSLATTAISTITLTTLHAQHMHTALQERAQRMAAVHQLETAGLSDVDGQGFPSLTAPGERSRANGTRR